VRWEWEVKIVTENNGSMCHKDLGDAAVYNI
jgi:hypothetical protein